MAKLNKRQEAMVQSYTAFKGAARGMVVMFEQQLQGYWGEDSRDSQWLAFFTNLISDTPRLQKDVVSLIPRYTGCTVSRDNGVFIVENNKDLTKKQKETYRTKVGALVAAEWATIQDIDKPVKEDKQQKPADHIKKYKAASKACLMDGLTPQQLLTLMEQVAIDLAQEEEKKEKEALLEKEVEAVIEERNEIAALEEHLAA